MTSFRLKELRDLYVVVIHPPDQEGQMLINQLSRIGCRTELIWPPTTNVPQAVDVVFAGVFFETHEKLKSMLKKLKGPTPTVLAIVNYENPAMLQKVLEIDAQAVISKPIRSFGMMTNLVLARANWHQIFELKSKTQRLEKKISIDKKVSEAKHIIMDMQAVSEKEAYKRLRSKAMSKRLSIEEMADIYINAKELLSNEIDDV